MNGCAALLETAQAAGVRLTLDGDKIKVRADHAPPAALLEQLKAHRSELLAELQRCSTPPNTAATVQPPAAELMARCKEACKNLSLWPQELGAALSEKDRAAILTGDPAELRALRCFAEGLAARLRTGKLPENLREAYERLRRQLAEHPGLKFACEVFDPASDPVLMAVCVRGSGFATLRMPRANYSEGKLLELVHRWNPPKESPK